VVRGAASSDADPYSVIAAGMAPLSGHLHGGANEAVLKMLKEIGAADRVGQFMASVKAEHGRLMGFGHRVYKNYDPRARIVRQTADRVFGVTGVNALLEIALELERAVLADDYFLQRRPPSFKPWCQARISQDSPGFLGVGAEYAVEADHDDG
jgi:citrate synthase